jgi:carbamoyl-phosphate synthase large subunit
VDLIKSGKVDLFLNTPLGRDSFFGERAIRRAAMQHRIPCITTYPAARP